MLARGERQRRLARLRDVDVVPTRLQVRRERAEDLRLVVDDEDARHAAVRSRATTVRPPPGVSSTSISPPIASTKPFATARPSPTPSSGPAVAEALERPEQALPVLRRDAGPAVGDADVQHPSTAPAVIRAGGPRGEYADRVLDHVRERALEQPRVREHARQRLRRRRRRRLVADAEAVQRRGEDLVEPDRRRR